MAVKVTVARRDTTIAGSRKYFIFADNAVDAINCSWLGEQTYYAIQLLPKTAIAGLSM
jgi:hypothetical protein